MILLDTDHLTVLWHVEDPRFAALTSRIQAVTDQEVAATVISLEEQMRGWLAAVHRLRDFQQQVPVYERLARLVAFFHQRPIVPFEARAADACDRLRRQRIRIGTQDLKIASIALVNDALLLTANLRDFNRVPGLRVENWLD